ncbi:hypothetical protein DWZ97_12495 [Firmicutes bacterium AF36-19BH]|nr:hypothetical protein DWZ97_12495 [Firmicutes bacterium AF36-19BH]
MLDYEVKAMLAWQRAKAAAMKGIREFLTDENGDTNMISIVVVLMIVLGLAAAFRKNITSFVQDLWDNITENQGKLTGVEITN